MKDGFALLAVGLVVSILAWIFWSSLGNYGFDVLALIAMLGLAGDNYQLRKKVKEKNSDKSIDSES
jgi:hypothetical protein